MNVQPSQRFTRNHPCPICEGWDQSTRGAGTRCYGFLSSDGEYAHCTNDGARGRLEQHRGEKGGQTYAHRLTGPCRCGETHRPAAAGHIRSIGESPRAEIVAEYDYCDEHGTLIYQVVRKHPKAFLQRRPDDRGGWSWGLGGVAPLLYRLPEVIAAAAAEDAVWIAEGEKDADALAAKGVVATCNSGGAGKFPAGQAHHLAGAHVTIVQDKDDPGRAHARDVAAKLMGHARTVRIVEAKQGKDAADHLAAGLGLQDFVQVEPAPTAETDLVAWKRALLRAKPKPERALRLFTEAEAMAEPDLPCWPSGLYGPGGQIEERMPLLSGFVAISGKASAAKSYLAISSSIEAARKRWDVLYVTSELGAKQIYQRARKYCEWSRSQHVSAAVPSNWRVVYADMGASLDGLIALCEPHITERNTLIVVDSLSSFVDNAETQNVEDLHNIAAARQVVMWCKSVKTNSAGKISFILLSEMNARGESKGRFLDHKADIALAMESDEDKRDRKLITVAKSNGAVSVATGSLGAYWLEWTTASLMRQGI